jgi:hypothetical protein
MVKLLNLIYQKRICPENLFYGLIIKKRKEVRLTLAKRELLSMIRISNFGLILSIVIILIVAGYSREKEKIQLLHYSI